jgi:hypothetical protein
MTNTEFRVLEIFEHRGANYAFFKILATTAEEAIEALKENFKYVAQEGPELIIVRYRYR